MLVLSLPGASKSPRMRVWRALKAVGAAALREGVYLLPDRPALARAFDASVKEVRRVGGNAEIFLLETATDSQHSQFQKLFDRSRDYAPFLATLRALHAKPFDARTQKNILQLKRDYEAVSARDYYPGEATRQIGERLADLEQKISSRTVLSEPRARDGRIKRLAPRDYRAKLWATRARPWVDRLASAWLIKRFVDPQARIAWLKDPRDCPKRALGFDFDGATFTHVGSRVTFEVLTASFDLEKDPAIKRLGEVVHYLDVGGVPVPEAAGLKTILHGACTRLTNDDELLSHASKIFDSLYQGFSSSESP
jgi:hypothetical protein